MVTTATPVAVAGKVTKLGKMYIQMVTDLRGVIETHYETLGQFAKHVQSKGESMQADNLYRLMPNDKKDGTVADAGVRKMSLELYVRILRHVGVGGSRIADMAQAAATISVMDFLALDGDIIHRTIEKLPYEVGAPRFARFEALADAAANADERRAVEIAMLLEAAIVRAHGNISKFCQYAAENSAPLNEANLRRTLGKNAAQGMSLELFVRLCSLLNIGGERMRALRIPGGRIPLAEYLKFDKEAILLSFTQLQYYDFADDTDEDDE